MTGDKGETVTPFLPYAAIQSIVVAPASAPVQDRFFDSDGERIRYIDQGSGEPIVLVHGYGSNIEVEWVETGVFQNLAKDHRVIALDCRGHGRSAKPHDVKKYRPHMGADVVRLLDHLNIQKAHIVGYSMGGSITVKLLTTNPERFLTATIGAAGGRLGWSSEEDRRNEMEATEMEQGILRSTILRLTSKNKPKPTEEEIGRASAARLAGQDRHALAAVKRSYRYQVVTDAQMAAVKVPTLAIAGSVDPIMAKVDKLKKVMPTLKVVVIEGASHTGFRGAMRRPEFVHAICEFIASHRDTSSQ